jgi:predicted Zn-dependent protease
MPENDSIQADYDEAMQALAEDDMDAARVCLRRLLKSYPDDHRTVELSGDFARLRGEYDKADKLYQRMPTLCKDKEVLALSLVSRGILYAEQDRREEACNLFRKAIPIYRELDDAHRLINA